MNEDEFKAQTHIVGQQTIKINPIIADGVILDIGGGGKGIIGKLNGSQVIAIDKRPDELLETDNDAVNIVMDATDLQFLSGMFSAVTSFFTLMYIPNEEKRKVFSEIYRVLRQGARLYIWDAVIPERIEDKKYYLIQLRIEMPNEVVNTGYGVKLKDQNHNTIQKIAEEVGLRLVKKEVTEATFHLVFEK